MAWATDSGEAFSIGMFFPESVSTGPVGACYIGALRAQVRPRGLRDRVGGGLGGAVGDCRREAHEADHRENIHDSAAAILREHRRQTLGQRERSQTR